MNSSRLYHFVVRTCASLFAPWYWTCGLWNTLCMQSLEIQRKKRPIAQWIFCILISIYIQICFVSLISMTIFVVVVVVVFFFFPLCSFVVVTIHYNRVRAVYVARCHCSGQCLCVVYIFLDVALNIDLRVHSTRRLVSVRCVYSCCVSNGCGTIPL